MLFVAGQNKTPIKLTPPKPDGHNNVPSTIHLTPMLGLLPISVTNMLKQLAKQKHANRIIESTTVDRSGRGYSDYSLNAWIGHAAT